MKGSRNRVSAMTFVTLFALAFAAGALVTFGIASFAGDAVRASGLTAEGRRMLAAMTLLAFAAVDLVAIRRNSYCPLGVRRQTPRTLAFHLHGAAVATWWGFDTGLVVTTFRVAALTWGALVLALLGFATWKSGIGYALGFVVPLTILLLLPMTTTRLAAFIGARRLVQGGSVLALCAAASVLLV